MDEDLDLQDMTAIDEDGGNYVDGGADGEKGHDHPSGLSGLVGGRRKGVNWAQIATKVCVRSHIAKMLQKVRKRHHAVTLPIDKLIETIAHIFQAKSIADTKMEEVNRKRVGDFESEMDKFSARARPRRNSKTTSKKSDLRRKTVGPNAKRPKLPKLLYYKRFDKFILAYFKSMYGSLDIAKRQMQLLMVSVKAMANDHPRVMLFARMAGLDIPGQLLISGHYYPYLTSEFLLPALRKLSDQWMNSKVKGKRSLFAYLQQGAADKHQEHVKGIQQVTARKEYLLELLDPTFANLPADFSMVQDFHKFVNTPTKEGGAMLAKGKVEVEQCLDRAARLWERCVMFRSFTLHKAIRILAKTNKLKKILYRIRARKAAELAAEQQAALEAAGSSVTGGGLKEDGVASAPSESPTLAATTTTGTPSSGGKEDGIATAPVESVADIKSAVPSLALGGIPASESGNGGETGGGDGAIIFESPRVVQALADAKALDTKINDAE